MKFEVGIEFTFVIKKSPLGSLKHKRHGFFMRKNLLIYLSYIISAAFIQFWMNFEHFKIQVKAKDYVKQYRRYYII